MAKLGLTLNETKTSVRDARQEHFSFLGYTFGPHYMQTNGRWYLGPARRDQLIVATYRRPLPWLEFRHLSIL
jgi:RNA-directed DNA polymerase